MASGNTLIKKKIIIKKGLFNYGQDIVMAFWPPVVCFLVKKGLQKGGHGHPRTPLATPMPWSTRTSQIQLPT